MTTPPTGTPPTGTPPTEHEQQQGPEVTEPTAGGRPATGTAATGTPAIGAAATGAAALGRNGRRWWRRNAAAAERGSGARDRNDPAADRNADEPEPNAPADAAVPAVRSDAARSDAARSDAARSDAARSGAVVSVRTEAVQEWVGGLRPWNLPLGSPQQLVQFARTAPVNLGHIDAVRAANIVFVALIAVPVILGVSTILWAFFVQLHRAITCWVITLVVAPFANRLADPLVWDGLDASTWSATTWQGVAGALAAFAVATTVALKSGRRR